MDSRNLLEFSSESDHDGIFISIADLFSLLSLVIIFVAFTSEPAVIQQPSSWEMVRANAQTKSSDSVVNPQDVYIEFARSGGNLMIEERWNMQTDVIPILGSAFPSQKLEDVLRTANPRRNIYIVASAENADPALASLFVSTLAFFREQDYPGVRIAIL